jgi:hypothetical protein
MLIDFLDVLDSGPLLRSVRNDGGEVFSSLLAVSEVITRRVQRA